MKFLQPFAFATTILISSVLALSPEDSDLAHAREVDLELPQRSPQCGEGYRQVIGECSISCFSHTEDLEDKFYEIREGRRCVSKRLFVSRSKGECRSGVCVPDLDWSLYYFRGKLSKKLEEILHTWKGGRPSGRKPPLESALVSSRI